MDLIYSFNSTTSVNSKENIYIEKKIDIFIYIYFCSTAKLLRDHCAKAKEEKQDKLSIASSLLSSSIVANPAAKVSSPPKIVGGKTNEEVIDLSELE